MRRLSAIAGVLLFLTLDAAHAGAQTVLTGEAGHAFYRIVVPDSWNGQLVIWNHGISLDASGAGDRPRSAGQRAAGGRLRRRRIELPSDRMGAVQEHGRRPDAVRACS